MTGRTRHPSVGGLERDVRVAVDIGGTFTDLVAVDGRGCVRCAKSFTTSDGLERGVFVVLAAAGVSTSRIGVFVHGSTVVINALTERRGAETALVTTRGFRDVLEIGRANRPDLYNLRYRKPPPFVPRRLRFEVSERVDYHGRTVVPLARDEVVAVAREIEEAGVQAVAVSYLHAWAAPAHEAATAELLRRLLPGVSVVASHEVSQQWREYERTSTTVLSAYVQPVVTSYLSALSERLEEDGSGPRRYAMQSAGGACSFERAMRSPITMLESGPAAGVRAAAALGDRIGAGPVLAFDVGGTTAKVCAVTERTLPVNTLHYIGRGPRSAGYPVQVPVVDIVEVGTGGGSIARVDGAGGLHVGPTSSGADPGPACYGLGATEPTLTDANLLCGRLDPGYFLGGRHVLDLEAATCAMGRLARGLGVGTDAASRGVLRLAVSQMANALRLVTLRRGYDPRNFTLIAYGGNGPLHATLLARELGITRVVVPPTPGHFSALGMLTGAVSAQAVKTFVAPLEEAELGILFAELEARARAEIGEEPALVNRWLQLRSRGQEHSLEIAVPDVGNRAERELLVQLEDEFASESDRRYALRLDAPLEVVAARVEMSCPTEVVSTLSDKEAAPPFRDRSRRVDFDQHGGVLETPVVHRHALEAGSPRHGPLLVEEEAATTLVLPGQVVMLDEHTDVVVEERHGR